jgi:phosphate transport system substrate-binding protein
MRPLNQANPNNGGESMPLPHCCIALAAAVALAPASGRAGGSGGGPSPGDAGTSSAQTAAVRLHGAASAVDSLAKPHAAAVEKATGLKLVIDRSNAGKGLRDLVEGKCDIALASASLEATLEAAKTAGLTAKVPDLRMHPISSSEVVFIVHPSNPVRKLTWEQIRDIHTGKIKKWNEVGGSDASIAVVTDAAASATRGLIKQVVLGGAEYAPGARAVAAVAEVNEEVAKNPVAIGGLGREFADPKRVTVVETKKVERPLAFITVGQPGPKEAKVIDAYRAQVKGETRAR